MKIIQVSGVASLRRSMLAAGLLFGLGTMSGAQTVTPADLSSLSTRDGRTLWVGGFIQNGVGFRTFLSRSLDGGRTWKKSMPDHEGGIEVVHFLTEKHGWAAGEQMAGGGHNAFVLRTTDGGVTWKRHGLGGGPGRVQAIRFTTPLKGRALVLTEVTYDKPLLFQTIDGGVKWHVLHQNSPQHGDIPLYPASLEKQVRSERLRARSDSNLGPTLEKRQEGMNWRTVGRIR